MIAVRVENDACTLARISLLHCDTEALILSTDSFSRVEYFAPYGLYGV